MAKSVVRGKALVAKFRADPSVRDPEALAAYAGRQKALRKATKGKLKHRIGNKKKVTKAAPKKKTIIEDDDPFNEDFGQDEKTAEEKQQEKYEAKILRDIEKAERSRLHSIIHETGGLQTRDALREEYSEIPNTFKRRDGLPGDEMAEYLSHYYPEFGIEDERDLIDFLVS